MDNDEKDFRQATVADEEALNDPSKHNYHSTSRWLDALNSAMLRPRSFNGRTLIQSSESLRKKMFVLELSF